MIMICLTLLRCRVNLKLEKELFKEVMLTTLLMICSKNPNAEEVLAPEEIIDEILQRDQKEILSK